MPHFHFHLHDSKAIGDDDGVELPDVDAARAMAADFLGQAIKDASSRFFDGSDLRLEVTDERGLILFAAVAFPQAGAMQLRAATG